MPFPSRQCQAISQTTGKQCRRWTSPGFNLCSAHGGGCGHPRELFRSNQEPLPSPALKGNLRAIKHGGYSSRLLPQERALYDDMRFKLKKEFGSTGPSITLTEHIIHEAAFGFAKLITLLAHEDSFGAMIMQDRRFRKALKTLKWFRAHFGMIRS
jgi:hypothetical protein